MNSAIGLSLQHVGNHFGFLLLIPFLACQIQVEAPPESAPELNPNPGAFDADFAPIPPSIGDRTPERPSPGVALEPGADRDEPWLPHRDLIAIDPELVQGSLASNSDPDAPLSFRGQMAWLSASTRDPLEFARSWLLQWTDASSASATLAPVSPRPGAESLLIRPWLGASPTPAQGSAADAGAALYPTYPTNNQGPLPSWSDAPFQLVAIVNRVDLAAEPCSGSAGELRYVYSALDVATGQPLDMTVIVEIAYPTLRPAADWARTWLDIGGLPPGETYESAIEALAREVQRDADPLRVRIRTNEIALGEETAPSWELREFHVQISQAELGLVQVPLESTPRADADPAALAEHVIAHSDEIMSGAVPLPPELRAGAAQIPDPDFSWRVLGVSERLRQAFSVETCNGCHGGDTEAMPFRHIGPGPTPGSRARLSRFLYNPEAASDELTRRSQVLSELSSHVCAPPEPSPYGAQ